MPLPTDYQRYIHTSRYARYLPDERRRETWEETVGRYIGFFQKNTDKKVLPNMAAGLKHESGGRTLRELKEAIINLEVMPSMRAMMSAGKALERDNVAGFNCAYTAIDHLRCFDEIMYILMCGTGVGFSVERQEVGKLPVIAEEIHDTETVIHVRDSKIGWATGFKELLSLLFNGQSPRWNLNKIRPSGSRLKTFGGRASGPQPLEDLFQFSVGLIKGARGRKLTSIECHDLVCKIADIVVVGGVRRSALISLSNLSDDRMRGAKSGAWWTDNPQRALANNSAVFDERPEFEVFLREWSSLYASKSGERGIFSRLASRKQAAKNGRRDASYAFGTNPCSEIILRSGQFCNLSEVVVRAGDTLDNLKRKVRLATILGTLQATLTDFRYLRKHWSRNTREEALLGVSLTGIMDNKLMAGCPHLPDILEKLKDVAVETNKVWAAKLDIPQSAAITCVKPSGTVSQLVDSASGIHARFSSHYIRRVRNDKKDPLSDFMIANGVEHEADQTNPSVWVFSFPQKAPDGAVVTADLTALKQLELWKVYQDAWCEHKPSITVYYSDEEFLEVGAWVYRNLEDCSGVSFLPRSDHIYAQAPYEAITKEQFDLLVGEQPEDIPWDEFSEGEDNTTGSQELACSAAGGCEI
jgi:ribonucleoside-diphosphate reductase alpha chain